MKSYPDTWALCDLMKHVAENSAEINGKWVPARALGLPTFINRLKSAWAVFTGRADVLYWPEGQ